MTKLHLGCGRRLFHHFVNVDILPDVGADVVEDIFTLPSFESNSADLIVVIHAIEHCGRKTYMSALKRWHEVLKPGGTLRIAVPDIRAAMEWYLKTFNLRDIHGLLWGGQKDEYDHHCIGWDQKTLTEDLTEVGFVNVRRYDWRTTEHFYVDDYSSAALPCVSYKTRTGPVENFPVSLNMECYKPASGSPFIAPSFYCPKCGKPPYGYSAPDLDCRCEDGPKMSPECAKYRKLFE